MYTVLERSFYTQKTETVAKALLGKQIVHITEGPTRAGIIVETEAYFSGDPASHCFNGPTARNKALFGPVGHAYVYFIYGNHYCLYVVAHDEETLAGGVLIRALEPTQGIEKMITARNGINRKTDKQWSRKTNPGTRYNNKI